MKHLKLTIVALLWMVPLSVFSQMIRENRQQKFPKAIPAGNYSGITNMGNDRYAVVCDKSVDGFYVFHIDIDTVTGRIVGVANEGFCPSGKPNRDQEGIAFNPFAHTLFISGEADNQVLEYTTDGQQTGRRLAVPPSLSSRLSHHYGLESLCYDQVKHCYYTVSERPAQGDSLLRLLALADDGTMLRQYAYSLDAVKQKHSGVLVNGVSELCMLDDGRLLVLERTVRVPRLRIGSYVECRLYEVWPADEERLQKHLLHKFHTKINLTRRNFANYEGMCVAKRQDDGRLILLLIADSQNQYKGVLRDWMKTLIIK
ncbi:MAG: esterase-like activity of phytase family protein [Prevotella sp.]|nr:esterase-like activity of phytase family protein [Prevotella sp.]